MENIADVARSLGVVPVLVLDRVEDAKPLAKALLAGGMPLAEVTLRTSAALDAIREMSEVDGILVGAGTVLCAEHVDQAVAAGATFIVSPGLDEGVVAAANKHGVPVFAGAVTAGEIQKAWNLGLRTVKFFPAGIAGGVKALKGMSSVFRDMTFMPTGGVSMDNLEDYLGLPAVIACGGSWIAPEALVAEGKFDEITTRAAEAVAAAKLIIGTK